MDIKSKYNNILIINLLFKNNKKNYEIYENIIDTLKREINVVVLENNEYIETNNIDLLILINNYEVDIYKNIMISSKEEIKKILIENPSIFTKLDILIVNERIDDFNIENYNEKMQVISIDEDKEKAINDLINIIKSKITNFKSERENKILEYERNFLRKKTLKNSNKKEEKNNICDSHWDGA